eukprot:CAMPEP_0172559310 /NCGR_PEP_ID=MMETSP1067-20121228/83462_1 /TAXON_ID=265564 ORGANISM="Thalassiosira punctigera, Strain Tpunct2005C2" /NCGR_SAMPLE_ID=MMETSP1067 /ASSEMBLY_ACC=CAM_ASM_000444 /LENGTH=72 /DNA_ID=CAMNT_0013348873 /DNA_START=86 /DNA_END=304 /DNA_ORIENTATION=-
MYPPKYLSRPESAPGPREHEDALDRVSSAPANGDAFRFPRNRPGGAIPPSKSTNGRRVEDVPPDHRNAIMTP